MKLSNKILAVLLAMTLATSQGLAWDDEQQKEGNNKRKFIIAGAVVITVAAAAFGGRKLLRHFGWDLNKINKKPVVDRQEYIGIDLGTSKSGGGRGDELIPDAEGRKMTASVVAYDKDGKVLSTGNKALEEKDIVGSSKRIIGTSYNRAKEDDTLNVVADLREKMEHMAAIKTSNGNVVSPEKVATDVLKGVKQRIDKHYGKDFKKALITVPAYFFDFQKAATKRAAHAAGFEHVVLIYEPTAAAFAHGAAEVDIKKLKQGINYLVYDFGGGTMDVSIVTAKLKKKQRTFKVTSIAGNPRLGGDDIDKKIAEKFAQDLNIGSFDNASDETKSILRRKAEEAKIKLSDANNKVYESKFELEGKEVEIKIDIDTFNQEIDGIMEETVKLARHAIDEDPDLNIEDIHEVILVGGSSRNLLARQKLIDMFGESRLQKSLNGEIDPDEMVAKGAAKYAKFLDEQSGEYHLSNIVPISLRVDIKQEGKNGKLVSEKVITKFSDTPTEGVQSGSSLGKDVEIVVRQGESSIPEENVRLGSFKLKGEQAGEAVEIHYAIDDDGILEVTARNLDTNSVEQVTIDMSATPEEVDEVVETLGEVADDEQIQRILQAMKARDHELLEGILGELELTRAEVKGLKEKIVKLEKRIAELLEQRAS